MQALRYQSFGECVSYRRIMCIDLFASAYLLVACGSTPPTPTALPAPAADDQIALDCLPVGGNEDPMTCLAGIHLKINDGSPRPVEYDEHISLHAGDVLELVDMEYCASKEDLNDRLAGEAYLFVDGDENYDNGLYTRGGSKIHSDCRVAGDFSGSWTVQNGEHRVVIVLVHYFGDTQEIDDRFFINLSVEP